MQHLGEILSVILEDAFDLKRHEILDILGIKESTYKSYKRNARPGQIHGSVELYARFRELFGIDLYLSVMEKRIIVVDPTKLTPEEVDALKDKGAYVKYIPVFEDHELPFDREKRYPKPVFLVPREMCPEGEFGAITSDKGDYDIFSEILEAKADGSIKGAYQVIGRYRGKPRQNPLQ